MGFDLVNKKIENLIKESDMEIDDVFQEDEMEDGILLESQDNEEDLDIFKEMDSYLIEAMREQMRLEILADSNLSDSEKITLFKKVSEIQFDDNDIVQFAEQYISPVVELCESFITNKNSDDTFVIPVVNYEIAAILEDARCGRIGDDSLLEDGEEAMVNDEEGGEEECDEECDKEDNTESNSEIKEEINGVINTELAKELIAISLEENGIKNKKEQERIVNETINILALYGFDNLRPNIAEIVENVYMYDRRAEKKDNKRFFEVVEGIKAGEEINSEEFFEEDIEIQDELLIFTEGTEDRISNYISGQYSVLTEAGAAGININVDPETAAKSWDWVKSKNDQIRKAVENIFNKNRQHLKKAAYGSAGLTMAAIVAMSIAAYRYKKYGICQTIANKKKKYTCMASACDTAIRAVEAQKRACVNAKNPEKCKIKCDKIIQKWLLKKKKYIEKANKSN